MAPIKDLYDEDFFTWAIAQAEQIRCLSDCKCAASNMLDIERLAGEIADLGRSDVLRVQSLLRQALSHIIKIICDPTSASLAHWEREVMTFILDAEDSYAPSYRQRLDIDRIWQKAQREAALALQQYGVDSQIFPETCPLDVDWLMSDDFQVQEACKIVQQVSSDFKTKKF